MDNKNGFKRVLSNSSWMIFQQIYNMVLQVVIGAISARYLGPSNYGLLNYSASIIAFFSIVCRLGLDSVIINEMIKEPNNKGAFLGTAVGMRFVTSILSYVCITLLIVVIQPNDEVVLKITMLQGIAVILQTYEVFTYWFQLNLKMKYVSIATMIAQTALAIWRIILLINKASIYLFALSSSIQYAVCGIVVLAFFTRDKKNLTLSFSKEKAVDLLKNGYHFIISGLAITFYSQIDKIMIGKTISSSAVGFYTAAATVATMWEFVPNALINSMRPVIIETKRDDSKKYVERFQLLLLFVTVMSVVVSVLVTLFGKIAILVLYGKEYLQAVYSLTILVWSTGFAVIGTARSIWIVAEGYNKYTKYYIFIGAGVNFALNLLFIPYWGISGAAITTLISQVVVAFVSPLFFKKTRSFVYIYLNSFKLIPVLFSKLNNNNKDDIYIET